MKQLSNRLTQAIDAILAAHEISTSLQKSAQSAAARERIETLNTALEKAGDVVIRAVATERGVPIAPSDTTNDVIDRIMKHVGNPLINQAKAIDLTKPGKTGNSLIDDAKLIGVI